MSIKWNQGWTKGIKVKLLIAACIPMIAIGMLSAMSLNGLTKLGLQLENSYEVTVPTFDVLGGILGSRNAMNYYLWQSLYFSSDIEKRVKIEKKAVAAFEDLKANIKAYEATVFTATETENWNKFKKNEDAFFKLTEEIFTKFKDHTPESDAWFVAQAEGGEWHKYVTDLRLATEENIKLYKDIAIEENAAQKNMRADIFKQMAILIGIALFLTLGGILTIAHKVTKSVGEVVKTLSTSSSELNDALEQMSAAGQTLSQTSTSSAASLEETVASLEELTSMVNLNSDNASSAAGLSTTSREVATQGETGIKKLLIAMGAISNSSKRIEEITNVIDDIAFQTNLLALNASVEAARAGEHGKGFAVVADAVRTLAQRAGTAAKDISLIIKESVDQVDQGSKIAKESSEVLAKIVESVKKVADINSEISSASSEQAIGIKQISTAMNQLDQSTQSNAASSEEIAATSTEISSQAAAMKDAASVLETIVMGNAA